MKILVRHLVCWMENYLINMHTFIRCKPSCSQVQLRSYTDFIIATFNGQQASIFIQQILPDKQFIVKCVQKSEHFIKVCILAELLTRWYSRENIMPTQTTIATTSLTASGKYMYCYCKEDWGGEMVGCDNGECLHGKWFHLYCLKLKCAPRSKKWHCPNCRALPEFSRKRSKKSWNINYDFM